MAERTRPSTHRADEVRKKISHTKKPKKQERLIAKTVGGRRQPGSGSYDEAKGDVSRDVDGYLTQFPLLTECKRTSRKKSISVKAQWLAKITREAFRSHKHPALAIEFDKEIMDDLARNGMSAETGWVMFPRSTVQAIFEALEQEGPDFGG